MKRSLINIIGFSIEAIDGPKGKVKDFLFDDSNWIVRYMEADLGNLFKNKRVLIPGIFLKKPDIEHKQISVTLDKEKIENCPVPEDMLTISKEYEKMLSEHYGHDWPWMYAAPEGAVLYPSRPITVPNVDEKDLSSSLRSLKEVKGYEIHALDGRLGHIDDIIIDENDFQIVYAVIDTSNWLPWSKKVLLSINWLSEISYIRNEVLVNLHTDTIKNAPEFDHDRPVEPGYEQELAEYYNMSLVK